ncbi:Bromodomain adjacent to zinc finger domain protein 2B, partial [Exaiptasia diaphana]
SFNAENDVKENGDTNPLSIAATRLAALEQAIERRYFKHPFRDDKLQIPSNIGTALAPGEVPTDASNVEEYPTKTPAAKLNITPALRTWRNAVAGVTNASQLSMCMTLFTSCIAWEKSIMKVFCQMCRKGDNEELLLLCDACDRGYHTYCCT